MRNSSSHSVNYRGMALRAFRNLGSPQVVPTRLPSEACTGGRPDLPHIANVRLVMIVNIRKFDDRAVLSGAMQGKRAFLKMAECVALQQIGGAPLYVDFTGVEVATGSYLREAIIHMKEWCRTTEAACSLVVANADAAILEELTLVTEACADAILSCDLKLGEEPTNGRLIGRLEAKQREAFWFVQKSGKATAQSLKDATSQAKISPTAWNNRLNVLSKKGVVRADSDGRTKVFHPIIREVHNGN